MLVIEESMSSQAERPIRKRRLTTQRRRSNSRFKLPFGTRIITSDLAPPFSYLIDFFLGIINYLL
ncbi:hypothetical protein NPIL_169551, partial [Nephila pilipes]